MLLYWLYSFSFHYLLTQTKSNLNGEDILDQNSTQKQSEAGWTANNNNYTVYNMEKLNNASELFSLAWSDNYMRVSSCPKSEFSLNFKLYFYNCSHFLSWQFDRHKIMFLHQQDDFIGALGQKTSSWTDTGPKRYIWPLLKPHQKGSQWKGVF